MSFNSLDGLILTANIHFYDEHLTLRAVDDTWSSPIPCIYDPIHAQYTIDNLEPLPNCLTYMKAYEITGDNYINMKYVSTIADSGVTYVHTVMLSDVIDVKSLRDVMSSGNNSGDITARMKLLGVSNDIRYSSNVVITLSKYQHKWYVTRTLVTLDKTIGDALFKGFVNKMRQRCIDNYE